jgi:hypothetical protein
MEYRPNVYEEMRDDLPNFFSGDRMEAFLSALAHGAQTVHNDIYETYIGTSLEAATGEALDQWGDWVGDIIRAKIIATDKKSSTPVLAEVYRTAISANDLIYSPAYPAGISLTAIVDEMPGEYYSERIRNLLERKADGRTLVLKVAFSDTFTGGDVAQDKSTARIL